MRQHITILTLTLAAAGAVQGGRFVDFSGAQLAAEGGKVMGVAHHDQDDGKDYAVDTIGTAVVEAGGAIAVGDEVVSDASGRGITNPEVGGEYIAADALEEATEAGQHIEVLLRR